MVGASYPVIAATLYATARLLLFSCDRDYGCMAVWLWLLCGCCVAAVWFSHLTHSMVGSGQSLLVSHPSL